MLSSIAFVLLKEISISMSCVMATTCLSHSPSFPTFCYFSFKYEMHFPRDAHSANHC